VAIEPVDMRSGTERLLAQVVAVFGAAQAHHGYLFTNGSGTRLKLQLHDGFGVWGAARLAGARRVCRRSAHTGAIRLADRRPAMGSLAQMHSIA